MKRFKILLAFVIILAIIVIGVIIYLYSFERSSGPIVMPPLYPSLKWTEDTSIQHGFDISGATTTVTFPAKEWVSTAEGSVGQIAGSSTLDRMGVYFKNAFEKAGWTPQIKIFGKPFYVSAPDGRLSGGYSYYKINNNNLYIFLLKYRTDVSTTTSEKDGPGFIICPCKDSYQVLISEPIPLKRMPAI